MKTMKQMMMALMALFSFFGCVSEEEYLTSACPLQIEVIDAGLCGDLTRANYSGLSTTFASGDRIGVYAVDGSGTVRTTNALFTFDGTSWSTSSTVTFNKDWSYYAYYPYVASPYTPDFSQSTVNTIFANFITDSSDKFHRVNQSTLSNFTASDLMIGEGSLSGTNTVRFTMIHKKGLAIFDADAVANKWYYSGNAGEKYSPTVPFTGNIPYAVDGSSYYLMKPDVSTSIGGQSLSASSGHLVRAEEVTLTGTPTYTYYLNGSASSSSKPSWLTITANVEEGEPTELVVTATPASSSSYRSYSDGANTEEVSALQAATPASDVDLSMVDNAGSPRAGRTTANCYLVHASGSYKLPLVYGNAIRNGSTNRNAYYTTQTTNTLQNFVNHNDAGIYTGNDTNDPWIKNHSITVAGARLIWQDVQGMFSSVAIDGDYLTFTVDPDHIAPGNAVIAATTGADGTGDVVWSWHIWVTSETLATTTTISTGSHDYEIAPVNIGHISSTVRTYTGNTCRVQATSNGVTLIFDVAQGSASMPLYSYAPYYQWGRKDPMIPSSGSGAYNHNTWSIDGTQLTSSANNTSYSYITGTHSIGETIQNPISFYYNSSTYGPYNETKYNYWDAENTTLDNSSSTPRSVATVKTVYDPCPPDFCVPTSNCFYYIYSNYSSYFPWSSTPAGRTWNKNGASVFFPASGYRYYSSGRLSNVGSYGYYWAATPYSTSSGRYISFISSSTFWNGSDRAGGFPVRAVAEE